MVDADAGQGLDGGDGAGRTCVEGTVDRTIAASGGSAAGVRAGGQVHHRVARDLDRSDPRPVLREVGEHHRVAARSTGVAVLITIEIARVRAQDEDVGPVRVVVEHFCRVVGAQRGGVEVRLQMAQCQTAHDQRPDDPQRCGAHGEPASAVLRLHPAAATAGSVLLRRRLLLHALS